MTNAPTPTAAVLIGATMKIRIETAGRSGKEFRAVLVGLRGGFEVARMTSQRTAEGAREEAILVWGNLPPAPAGAR